jgi:hypothetical protein
VNNFTFTKKEKDIAGVPVLAKFRYLVSRFSLLPEGDLYEYFSSRFLDAIDIDRFKRPPERHEKMVESRETGDLMVPEKLEAQCFLKVG